MVPTGAGAGVEGIDLCRIGQKSLSKSFATNLCPGRTEIHMGM